MRPASLGTFAIAFGAFILCAETCLHFAEIVAPASWTSLPIHDWIAGGFLIYAGVITRRDSQTGLPYQAAAWAFMASLLLGAFVGHWEGWSDGVSSEDWISEPAFLAIIGALLIGSVYGLAGTLVATRRR